MCSRRFVQSALQALLMLVGARAGADCPVTVGGSGFTPEMTERVKRELDVELERAKTCQESDAPRVSLLWEVGGEVAVSVRSFRRNVNPAEVPQDGLALTLAAVAAELLTQLETAPPPAPVKVEEAAPEQPPELHAWRFGARFSGETWTSGLLQLGGDITFHWVPSRVGLELAIGGRGALTRTSSAGSVSASSALATLAVVPVLVRTRRLELSAEAALVSGVIWFTATPSAGFTATNRFGVVISARAGLELALTLWPVMLALRVGLDVPLHGVAATDGTNELGGVGGVGGYVAIGGGFGL